MLIRKVIQWAVLLLLLIAAVGGYAVLRTWKQRNALLLDGIRTEIATKAPDWDVVVGDAKIVNLRGRVRLTDIVIKPRGETTALLHIPECFITLDPDLLLRDHQVLIRKLTLSRPTVTLIRHADGTWNWQKLGRPAPSEQTPEVLVESGAFVVRVEAAAGLPETEIASRDVALSLLPAGLHRYLIEGASQIDGAGGLLFSGKIDLTSGAWELAGKADGLDMSPALLEKAAAFSPAVKRQVAELSGPGASLIPGASPLPSTVPSSSPEPLSSAETADELIRPVSQEEPVPLGVSQLSLPNLGLVANIAVDFELRSDGDQPIPDYRVIAKVMDGKVTEPLSPVPLSGLEGELLLENDRIMIHRVSAANGKSQLYLDGEVLKLTGKTVKRFNIRATNLWLDHQVRELLPPRQQRLFDLLNPSGRFTVKARYDSEAEKPLQLEQLTALDCAIQHAMFPYPVTGITGTIEQEAERLMFTFQGTAAERPVQISGEVRDPGPQGEVIVHIQADQFPIDRQFTEAIVMPQQAAAREAIESLNLTGLADLRVQFLRQAGPGQRFLMSVDADVSRATMNFNRFPYLIEHLSGHVYCDPLVEPVWRFTGLKGRHGPATLEGEVTLDLKQQPAQLALTVNAHNVPLDQQLREATVTANPDLAAVWEELNPSGSIDAEGIEVTWVPGTSPQIVLPSMRLERGTVELSSFPFPWDDVTADLSWRDGRVDLKRAEGRHNGTFVVIEGQGPDDPAFFELAERERFNWRLHLPKITVRQLDPGDEFAAALPVDAASVLRNLDPRGPVDAELWVEIAGFPHDQLGEIVTSAWDVKVDLQNDRIFAGLELTDVTGEVEAVARWDGTHLTADGTIDFQHARTFDMTCTQIRGPFVVNGTTVTVGSAAVLDRLKAPSDEQLTARLYDGIVKVNSVAQFDPNDAERTRYEVQVDLENADLSQWAEEWGAAEYHVAGTVNGRMNLYGRGTSPLALKGEKCWMQITDARLGELPQMAQLLNQITQLKQPDKTAFRYAYAEFSVADGRFDFGSPVSQRPGDDTRLILFDGNTLKMVGRGAIPFAPGVDPRMNLVFLSKVAQRNRLIPNIPFFSPIARSMVDNWIRIQVTGTPANPNIVVIPQVPLGNVNNVLREIFSTVETGLNPVFPGPPPPPSR